MIERIVLVKLADAAVPDRRAIADHCWGVLERMPGVEQVHVGRPADESTAEAWDLVLVLRFAGFEDVESYRIHPDHRAYVDEYLKPRMEAITAWNFEV
jgi:hypothetical protein